MLPYKKKIGNNTSATKSTDRLIRLLRSDVGFQASPISLERTNQKVAYDEHQEGAESAMLEGEYKKAKAIMAMQQHRSFC